MSDKQHKMIAGGHGHGLSHCEYCLATDREIAFALGPVCPQAPDTAGTPEQSLFAWFNNPSWAQEGGEHFDGNGVPDCQGKQDYDPGFLRFSCRVYPNGLWTASLILGDDHVVETSGMVPTGSVNEARKNVENWCADRAKHWAAVILAAPLAPTRS